MNLVRHNLVVLVAAATFVVSGAALGADWPQWRGPKRDGKSEEKGLLKQWPQEGPKLLWKAEGAGGGYSTPSVAGERLYLMGSRGLDEEFVQARAVADGKELWTVKVGKVGNPDQRPPYPGARSTPTVDGELLYALGSDGDLVCLEAGTGKVRWAKNLRKDFGGQPGTWAYSESPLVDGDRVLVTPGGPDAAIVALNKTNGDVVWKGKVPGGDKAGYASIIVADAAGKRQYVQFMEKGLVGFDAGGGEFLWRYEGTAKGSPANIPTPVVHGDYVYTGTSMGGGGLAKLSAKNGGVMVEQVYFNKKLPVAIGGSVVIDDHLYGTTNSAMMCVELVSGKEKWSERGIGAASVLYADGRLYLHGENGEVALVEPSTEGYREKGRFTPAGGPGAAERGNSKAWAYPVVANGKLYVRELGTVWCYDVRDANAVN
jgi:outer membrane protein assembly factor BamB